MFNFLSFASKICCSTQRKNNSESNSETLKDDKDCENNNPYEDDFMIWAVYNRIIHTLYEYLFS